ncbi:hypothetical protein [Mucilaginibacter endophyticus]|uniref:hypothetical protein n=1 Tax=Mucilaginibacter endophyticus TaxID=2675003 RepID=UPI000E0D67C2|nr:hypothetical protein [Mucilaginibacter endophyticus]
MNFNNATHITCANGLAVPENPNSMFINLGLTAPPPNPAYKQFEHWLSQQPELHCSHELSGTYPVDEFGEVATQCFHNDYRWVTIPNAWIQTSDQATQYNINTRQFLPYIGPKKQESEPKANCNGCGKEILNGEIFYTVDNGDDYCSDCYYAILSDDESSGRLDTEPATPEQKGVEQGEEKPVKITFGIQPTHLKAINDLLAK